MTAQRIALVLGATGGIGGEMTQRLLQRGWQVRALNRRAAVQPARRGLTWMQGDALSADDVAVAAAGAALIVHAANPPGYRHWNAWVLPMLEHSIAAARANGARLLLPGSLYNFDADLAGHALGEDAPQRPTTRKGAIRVAMEERLREAATRGVRSLIVRAGDYFGPHTGNTWFGQGLVQAGRPLKRIQVPNDAGVGHQWGYLPDVAETMMALIEREADLGVFECFHMAGHWDADGTQMTAAIRRAAGRALPARRFPWTLLNLASPFVTLFREMREMRYLWRRPMRLRNDKLVALLGAEPHTPLDEAVRRTLVGIGCLDASAPDQSASRLRQSSR